MKTLTTPTVLRKAHTSERSLQGPQLMILSTLEGLGMWPSGVQMCPATVISCVHNKDFLPEKVPPQYFILWTMQFRFWKCSQMKWQMLLFSTIVLKVPIRGLVCCCRTVNGYVVNIGYGVLGNLRLKDVHRVVVEYGDCISPTHWEFGETERAIWCLEGNVVTRCFSEHVFIVANILDWPWSGLVWVWVFFSQTRTLTTRFGLEDW